MLDAGTDRPDPGGHLGSTVEGEPTSSVDRSPPSGRPDDTPILRQPDSGRFTRRRRAFVAWLTAAGMIAAALTGGLAGWLVAQSTIEEDSATPATVPVTAGAGSPVVETLVGDSLDVPGVVELSGRSILAVEVTVEYRQGPFQLEGQGAGTGIVLTSDGLVVTNAHVVRDATAITVILPGESEAHDAELIGMASDMDVAVIQVSGVSDLVPATFADSDGVRVGDDVVAIGNALDLGPTMSVTRGIISALDRTIDTDVGTYTGLIQTDAAISSGNSGGALLDPAGDVIGMNSAAAGSSGGVTAENIGFAIPSNQVLEAITELGVSIG